MRKLFILISLMIVTCVQAQYLDWVDSYTFHFDRIEADVAPDTVMIEESVNFVFYFERGTSETPPYYSPYTSLETVSLVVQNEPALWVDSTAGMGGTILLSQGLYEVTVIETVDGVANPHKSNPLYIKIEVHQARVLILIQVK